MSEKKINFYLEYSGDAVNNGEIEMDDLVSGLIGIQNCFNVIQKECNLPPLKLEVKAFEEGSFITHLSYYLAENANLMSALANMFLSAGAVPAAVYYTMEIYKTLKGKTIREVKVLGNTKLSVKTEDGSGFSFETENPKILEKVLTNKKYREGLRDIVKPLEKGAIDHLKYVIKGEKEIQVNHDEKEYFDYSERKEIKTQRTTLRGVIRALDIKTNNGKFIYEGKTYTMIYGMENPERYYNLLSKRVEIECELEMNERLGIEKIIVFDVKEIPSDDINLLEP